jgi:predicted Na+-dependent transporter
MKQILDMGVLVVTVLLGLAMAIGLGVARWLRLNASDSMTMAILFAVRNVALATAIAVTLLNRTEFAVFTMVYFLAEVPLLLGTVATYRLWSPPRTMPLSQPAA